jgi:hypothetical protein
VGSKAARASRRPREEDTGRPAGGRLSRSLRSPSPFPPFLQSLGHGFTAVASSPPLILFTLLVVPTLWFGLLALGLDHFPAGLVDLLALPPISSFFDLTGLGFTLYGLGVGTLVFVLGMTVVRSVIWAILAGMIVEAIEFRSVSLVGVLRGLRAVPAILPVNMLYMSIVLFGSLVLPAFLGPQIGQLFFIAALVGGLYLLAFAPIVAVREERPGREVVRRSIRAALLPGPRHLILILVYFLVAVSGLLRISPGGPVFTANPDFVHWIVVLSGTVVHVTFLAALAYRWMVVEPLVSDEPIRLCRGRQPDQVGPR